MHGDRHHRFQPTHLTRNTTCPTAIVHAATGRTAARQALIERGARLDQAASDGETALISAARKGQIAAVRALLGAGANCNLKTEDGNTALSFAIAAGHDEVAQLLRANGATV